MARSVWVWRDGKMIPKEAANDASPRVHLHTDTMSPTFHPCNGKFYDSKSEFRRVTKLFGCHEIGNDYKNSEK